MVTWSVHIKAESVEEASRIIGGIPFFKMDESYGIQKLPWSDCQDSFHIVGESNNEPEGLYIKAYRRSGSVGGPFYSAQAMGERAQAYRSSGISYLEGERVASALHNLALNRR